VRSDFRRLKKRDRRLRERHVDGRLVREVDPPLFDVLHHADDRHPQPLSVAGAGIDAVAERAFPRPVLARQRFVHHDGGRRLLAIVIGEEATREDARADRLEITRAHEAEQRIVAETAHELPTLDPQAHRISA
jgi:hypothetical protein